jgi:hypothetical protein
MPPLEDIPAKWNGRTNWVPKLDEDEDSDDSAWKIWSWDCEPVKEDQHMGEACVEEEGGLGQAIGGEEEVGIEDIVDQNEEGGEFKLE